MKYLHFNTIVAAFGLMAVSGFAAAGALYLGVGYGRDEASACKLALEDAHRKARLRPIISYKCDCKKTERGKDEVTGFLEDRYVWSCVGSIEA